MREFKAVVSVQAIKNYLGNPSLLFAFAAALFWGHEGGAKLMMSIVVLAAIALCIAVRNTPVASMSLGRIMARPATAQALVGVLGAATAGLIFNEKSVSAFDGRDYTFLACALLNLISNALMARGLEKGFDNGPISLRNVLLSPQVWGIIGCVAGALYNSIYTVIGLPIMMAGVIVSVRGSLSLGTIKLEGVGMPYYLNIAYNFWYTGCNLLGDHPSTLMAVSSAIGGLACYSIGVTAERMAASGVRIPADQLVYIEIPGVVYRAPRPIDDLAYAWAPVSFDVVAGHSHSR